MGRDDDLEELLDELRRRWMVHVGPSPVHSRSTAGEQPRRSSTVVDVASQPTAAARLDDDADAPSAASHR
jgi:hypothetical protein